MNAASAMAVPSNRRGEVLDEIHKYNPVCWVKEELGLELDEWQKSVLTSPHKRKVLNCARQSGKSTVAAVKALHRAVNYEHSLVLLISPSLRQSGELFRRVTEHYDSLLERPKLTEDNRLSMTLCGGSRIVSLPSSESTVRGYSNVDLIIEDEAAAVPDELHQAVFPMLAVSDGEIDLLSTPRGRVGHFFEAWQSPDWQHISVTCEQVPRISAGYLEDARRRLGSRMFAQEFECQFLDMAGAGMFRREWFEIVDDYPRDGNNARYWDLAATADGGDYTAGVRIAEQQGRYFVVDVQHVQRTPGAVEALVRQMAELDGTNLRVGMEQEPGSSGVGAVDRYAREVLKGFPFRGYHVTGPKEQRAMGFAAAAEAKNVKLVRGAWNREFLDELVSFPEGEHDDMVDACSGAFTMLNEYASIMTVGGIDFDL